MKEEQLLVCYTNGVKQIYCVYKNDLEAAGEKAILGDRGFKETLRLKVERSQLNGIKLEAKVG